MSIGKELRDRFAQEDTPAVPSTEAVKIALGIATKDMEEVIIGDISLFIKADRRQWLDGYIYCLSRIIEHKRAWDYISKAFSSTGEKVPTKYYQQFGQTQQSENKPNRSVGK